MSNHVCPAERAGALDNGFRALFQNPVKIMEPYIKEGMTVADIGCGPGFFTLSMAQLVGGGGKVYGYDLQKKMLEMIALKIKDTNLVDRIELLESASDSLGFVSKVDFILAFYMVHETPDPRILFEQIKDNLVSGGRALVVEPKFHVTKKKFKELYDKAFETGLKVEQGPTIFFSRSFVLSN